MFVSLPNEMTIGHENIQKSDINIGSQVNGNLAGVLQQLLVLAGLAFVVLQQCLQVVGLLLLLLFLQGELLVAFAELRLHVADAVGLGFADGLHSPQPMRQPRVLLLENFIPGVGLLEHLLDDVVIRGAHILRTGDYGCAPSQERSSCSGLGQIQSPHRVLLVLAFFVTPQMTLPGLCYRGGVGLLRL